MFASGLITGALFPEIHTQVPPGSPAKLTLGAFINDTGPIQGIDFAKLFVWSFIAGFAERLVPDAIDRLAAKEADAEKKK
jgi:hypothetical protein